MMQFDTHKVFKKFKDAGIEDKIADAFVEAINEARVVDLDNLATKQDLADIKSEIKQDIHELDLKIAKLDGDFNTKFAKLDGDFNTLKWMFGFISGTCMVIAGALIKLIFSP